MPTFGEWASIESAPKDGTVLLLHNFDGVITDGYWLLSTAASPCWWSPGHGCLFPTHWMQLPSPHRAGTESRAGAQREETHSQVASARVRDAVAERLWESLGGDLCICQRADVSHWCESCQGRIDKIANALPSEDDRKQRVFGHFMADELVNAHRVLDRLGAPKTKEVPTRWDYLRKQDITLGIADRLAAIESRVGYHGTQPVSEASGSDTERSAQTTGVKQANVPSNSQIPPVEEARERVLEANGQYKLAAFTQTVDDLIAAVCADASVRREEPT